MGKVDYSTNQSTNESCKSHVYLSDLLLEGHEVQVRDVHHVSAAHHRQHPILHLSRQRADVQQLTQLRFLRHRRVMRQEKTTGDVAENLPSPTATRMNGAPCVFGLTAAVGLCEHRTETETVDGRYF